MVETKKYTIEGELAKALLRFSFGKLTIDEAKEKAAIAAKTGTQQIKHWLIKDLIGMLNKLFQRCKTNTFLKGCI